jgi:hypothetical protein
VLLKLGVVMNKANMILIKDIVSPEGNFYKPMDPKEMMKLIAQI